MSLELWLVIAAGLAATRLWRLYSERRPFPADRQRIRMREIASAIQEGATSLP